MWQIIKIEGIRFYWHIYANHKDANIRKIPEAEEKYVPKSGDNADKDNSPDLTCMLIGQNECWCAKMSRRRFRAILKELNPKAVIVAHPQLDEKFFESFLVNGQVLECVSFDEHYNYRSRREPTKILKLIYHFKRHRLRLDFELIRYTSEEMHRLLLYPLLVQLRVSLKEIDSLRDIIRSKDEELEQHHREGHTLRRATLITNPFNHEQHAAFLKSTRGQVFAELAQLLSECENCDNDQQQISKDNKSNKINGENQYQLRRRGNNKRWAGVEEKPIDKIQYEESSSSSTQLVASSQIKEESVNNQENDKETKQVQSSGNISSSIKCSIEQTPETKNPFDGQTEEESYLSAVKKDVTTTKSVKKEKVLQKTVPNTKRQQNAKLNRRKRSLGSPDSTNTAEDHPIQSKRMKLSISPTLPSSSLTVEASNSEMEKAYKNLLRVSEELRELSKCCGEDDELSE